MKDFLKEKLEGKKILLLGFGREGRSSYRLIREILPETTIFIADFDESVNTNPLVSSDANVRFNTGNKYLDGLNEFDIILKSPGVSLKDLNPLPDHKKITSQTDLFLLFYADQVIGITGTKGKSTTSSLLHYTLKKTGKDAILVGNIGRPALDCIEEIGPETLIVFELSSHQLEYITKAPRIAVLLNLYQEHLDAYHSFLDYQLAKMNILRCQDESGYFIYNADDELITGLISGFGLNRNYLPFSFDKELADGCFIREGRILFAEDCVTEEVYRLDMKRKLKGDHNLKNIMAVINACRVLGVETEYMQEGIAGFTGLEHRMELVGNFHGILFYNDSIATIPEATMEAVKSLEKVDTLILGGFDRGIDYSGLACFLSVSGVRNFILTGDAGRRIGRMLETVRRKDQELFLISRFDDFLDLAIRKTRPGHACLLSPAAASYDEFPNFEVRGVRFKELVKTADGDIQ